MTAKEELIEMIQNQPDNLSRSELLHNAKIKSDIDLALKQVEEGKTIPHDEAIKYLRGQIKQRAH